MLIQGVVLYIVAVFNIILAFIIATRNAKSRIHRLFGFTIFFNVLWTLGDAVMVSARSSLLFELAATFFFLGPMVTAFLLVLFSFEFVGFSLNSKVKNILVFLLLGFGIYIVFNQPLISSYSISDRGVNTFIVDTPYFIVYTLFFIIYFNLSYLALFLGSRTKKGIPARQIKTMFYAALLSSGFALFTNLFLPLMGDSSKIWLGPIFTIFYLILVTYSIARDKLFDIRSFAIRSLGYILSIFIILASSQLFIGTILKVGVVSKIPESLNATIFIIAGILLKPLKNRFDKLTNKIFYRDSYDTQQQIDKLSKIAVSEFNIGDLAMSSLHLLSQSIKPASGKLVLLDEHGEYYSDYRLHHAPKFGVLKMIEMMQYQDEQVFLVDQYEAVDDRGSNHEKAQLFQYLKDHDISMSIRLSTKDEVVGFIFFGPKLSGNTYSTQDIQFVGIAANEISIAILNARRFDEIKEFNQTLKLEVERATSELQASNNKLQALDQAKDEFITMASHQLRTPLTSVKGYLSMVLEGDTGKITPKQREMLSAAFFSSQRMVYLISDLLNVSRLQTGKFIIEPSVVDLPSIVASEIEQLKETAKGKNLKVTFKKPKKFPELYLDETKTRQVIMNFIDNAIYYTPSGGKIDVYLKADDKKIEYFVKDNGIGVPKEERHNLFTKFYRAKNARKARPDGTGLGLFMARKVIVDQGGAVVFDSKEGKGSTFGFTFPLTRVRPPKKLAKEAKS